LGLQYIYTWNYHKETHCVATCISKKQKYHGFHFIFSLFSSTELENRRVEQVLPGGYTSGKVEVVGKELAG
jgi:hypothetical protein